MVKGAVGFSRDSLIHSSRYPETTLKLCPECFTEYQDDIELCPEDGVSLNPIEPDPLIGTVLQERYVIQSVLGRGGMGVVYKAKHEQMDRLVAVKMLHLHMVADADAIKRFHREAKAVSRVRHPHSIMLYDFGVTPDGQPFIVMDYIEGTSLKRVIKQDGPLPIARIDHIFQQVIAALSCAHSEGVIHRDLKPENIMLTDRADDPNFVQVVDFGISKLKSRDEEEHTEYNITRIGDVCGSPPYMSPEQCLSAKPIDYRSDIYALGVVLYEALAGRLPFRAKTAIEMIDCHLYAPPTPLKAANPDLVLCDSLNNMLMKALQKEPERRQQSMRELGKELAEAVHRDGVRVSIARNRFSLSDELAVQQLSGSPDEPRGSTGKAPLVGAGQLPAEQQLEASSSSRKRLPDLWSAVRSLFGTAAKERMPDTNVVPDCCPYCASPVKPTVKFCLECGRNLPSLQEITKLRLVQGVFTLPRSLKSSPEVLDFSTATKMATGGSGAPWRVPRIILIVNIILLIVWCYLYLVPRVQQEQQAQLRGQNGAERLHAKRRLHHQQ